MDITENLENSEQPQWYAIRTRRETIAEHALRPYCDEVFFPKETVERPDKKPRHKALIPHVLFVRATPQTALSLEKAAHDPKNPLAATPFWIYRYPNDTHIRPISGQTVELLRLLTSGPDTKCEIYNKTDFTPRDRVLITGGIFKDYTGHVVRVRKNLHVLVQIEGICAVLLPYIHPNLLQKL